MAIGLSFAPSIMQPAHAAGPSVDLGTAGSYSVLGGQSVNNTGPSVLNNDVGVSPGTAITGFPPGSVNGATHAADAHSLQAQSDLTIAYDAAAGQAPDGNISDDIGGQTLTPGVYKGSSEILLTGPLTLDAEGDPNAVFVFQVGSTLTTATSSSVVLTNGAQGCNVFWQIGSSATLGTDTTFVGNLLALTSITVETGTTVDGRALARNGSVTLDNNTFTGGPCEDDDVAVAVAITSPIDGYEFTVPSADDSTDVDVAGTGEPGATVVVTLPGEGEKTVTVEDDGSWPVSFTEVPVGTYTVTAVQTTDLEGTSSATVDFSVVVEAATDADSDTDADAAADVDADTDAGSDTDAAADVDADADTDAAADVDADTDTDATDTDTDATDTDTDATDADTDATDADTDATDADTDAATDVDAAATADVDAAAGADSDAANADAASGTSDGPGLSTTGFEGVLYGGSAVLLLLAGAALFAISRKPRTSSGH